MHFGTFGRFCSAYLPAGGAQFRPILGRQVLKKKDVKKKVFSEASSSLLKSNFTYNSSEKEEALPFIASDFNNPVYI